MPSFPLLRALLAALVLFLGAACRSPLADLRPRPDGRAAIRLLPPQVEDHSRTLARIRDVAPGEANAPEARQAALEAHRAYLEAAFRRRAEARGLVLDPESPHALRLRLTTVGEVRAKYIAYGILSGVAWGVGTGLATHNPHLAVGLGAYELVEESVFWIAGSSLFGRWSSPVVLEAELLEGEGPKPLWSESYYVLWPGRSLEAWAPEARKRREVQIQATMERVLDQVFKDLAALPGLGPAPAPGARP